ncbi:MAG: dihydroneopterin aldolase [Pseudonocardiaceae bacterium]
MTCPLAQLRDPAVAHGRPLTGDVIEVDELRLRCVIGINHEERRDRQDVVISLRIGTNARPAAVIDSMGAVWNYRTATKAIIAHVEPSTFLTVEKLASEIARIVVADHAAPWVEVRVHKPGALRFAGSVGVVIHQHPDDFLNAQQIPEGPAPTCQESDQ